MGEKSVSIIDKNKDRVWSWIIVSALLAVGMLVFFCIVHPLYIYDTDDWTYISFSRHAWPGTDNWNPTKILPETLMPLTAEMGIRLLMPFTGDYVGSMAIAFAVVLTAFILVYVVSLGKVLEKKFALKQSTVFLLIALFVLYHFLPFSVSETGNRYLFYGGSVNCTFNYLIPGLLNASVTMYLMTHPQSKWSDSGNYVWKGVLVLALYLCINSNMFHSIILISFMCANLLISGVKEITCRKSKKLGQLITGWLKNNLFEIVIIFCWLISLVFEVNGGRAAWAAETGLFNLPIKETLGRFFQSIRSINRLYLFSILALVFSALSVYILWGKRKKSKIDKVYIENFGKIVICLSITLIYLVLLCAKVSPAYIENNLVMISWMFWLMLVGFISLAYMIVRVPQLILLLPLLLYLVIFETVIDGRSFAENNVAGFDSETVKALDNHIVEQMIAADEAGIESVNVYIPVHTSDSWPMDISYGGNRIATTLFRHGIVSRKMNVTLVMDQSINEEFQLR